MLVKVIIVAVVVVIVGIAAKIVKKNKQGKGRDFYGKIKISKSK